MDFSKIGNGHRIRARTQSMWNQDGIHEGKFELSFEECIEFGK